VTGDGLLARALCHEIDHLDGHLFLERTIRMLDEED
jgi:peptide deformylase